jgi:multidrug transporter EmrE-like cation transporter
MLIVLFFVLNASANTAAHLCFKRSSSAEGKRRFLAWQAAGNLLAFVGVLAYTAIMRNMDLHLAFPLTQGFTAIGVQIIGGLIAFRERIAVLSWIGTSLVIAGIIVIGA